MLQLAIAVLIVFIASIVRGFSGFGLSLLAITGLSLIYAPADIVPSIFMLELVASINLLPSIWKDIHWRSLAPLTLGCLIATPLGVWCLAHISPAPMQLALAIFVLVSTAILGWGFSLKNIPGIAGSTAVGAACGLSNGAFGIAGPPLILFYFSSPAGAAAGRASIVAFFLATDTIGLANQYHEGLLNWDVVMRAAFYLPAMLFGVWTGARSFKGVSEEKFRKVVLILLAIMAVIIGVKAVLALNV
ncbi:sulfite exporter TauE/SafE family protein [Aestuariivirga litoralis]|uniref:sulfite exporter TauE/SafE family protein n=1 Tax=Aestuariivirga litoralis TaxID=2650924 RepID=UPI0018C5792C|nr:sulfite exporter TauE/SafE family protein [Aestuariivirga litoralis]MBG1231707.1 sulfite exporter TauE/SafE family protein [Aestuariivirga litoralis]